MVETKRIELSTLRMRTVRSPSYSCQICETLDFKPFFPSRRPVERTDFVLLKVRLLYHILKEKARNNAGLQRFSLE